jgi:hypothetical protein
MIAISGFGSKEPNGGQWLRPNKVCQPLPGPRNMVLKAIKLCEESIADMANKLNEESITVKATTTVNKTVNKLLQ